MKWKCKDGRLIDLKDMSTQHLENSVAMLRRKLLVIQMCPPYGRYQGEEAVEGAEFVWLANMRDCKEAIRQIELELNSRKEAP